MKIEITLRQSDVREEFYHGWIRATGDLGNSLLDFLATFEPELGNHLLSSLVHSFADEIAKAEEKQIGVKA